MDCTTGQRLILRPLLVPRGTAGCRCPPLRYWYTWSLVPPLIKRLMRCNDDDVTALTQYVKLTAPPPLVPDTPEATLLVEARQDWSELWSGPGNPPLSCGEMTGAAQATTGCLMQRGVSCSLASVPQSPWWCLTPWCCRVHGNVRPLRVRHVLWHLLLQ